MRGSEKGGLHPGGASTPPRGDAHQRIREPLRGLTILNVPVGEKEYVVAKLRDKAMQVKKTTEAYAMDLGDEYPQVLWTMM